MRQRAGSATHLGCTSRGCRAPSCPIRTTPDHSGQIATVAAITERGGKGFRFARADVGARLVEAALARGEFRARCVPDSQPTRPLQTTLNNTRTPEK